MLLNQEHKESWHQMYVYSDLLDSEGMLYKTATIIDIQVFNNRSECPASMIKYLKQTKTSSLGEDGIRHASVCDIFRFPLIQNTALGVFNLASIDVYLFIGKKFKFVYLRSEKGDLSLHSFGKH